MSRLWNRQINIIFALRGEQGTKHPDLRIIFEIDKTSETNANPAKIQIYNLKESSRTFLEQKENVIVILEVGYEDNVDQLFTGDIVKSSTKKEGSDLITTIEAKDGTFVLENSHIDKSYEAGTNIKDVAKDVIKSMKETGGLIINSVEEILGETLQNGMSISGSSKKILENITNKQGREFSIQDNELQIVKQGGSTTEEAILLTPQTGLIGKPIRREEGIEFKALIQTTKFRPGRKIKIISSDIEGIYTARKIKYKGDSHGPDWFVSGEAIE